MARMGLLGFVALTFFILASVPRQALASSHGFYARKIFPVEPSSFKGLCSSAVTIHGYECQELEVRTLNIY